ncbi:MAG TPA: 16S rRNA (cytidine(1402)-2'-O)-methyltransferase [Candidatus Binatia bacterium]|nr:16S rRNA (cytidine(1402)-2'-O)-methyltransferase [Candidatus Binatia bacterium]
MAGILYVVATPIGNLEDVSERALRVLREVDRIAAEDTRRTAKLLARHGIEKPLTSYHDASERQKAPELVAELRAGKSLALVSDAGTPLISDPGYRLVRGALDAGIAVVPIPGPSAATALLSVCGFATDRFVFEGFLPQREGRRRRRLEALRAEPRTVVLYESPHHVERTLAEMEAIFGDRAIVVGRELTKLFEEIVRGTISSVRANLASRSPRGEYTLVVEGAEEEGD